MWRIVVSMLWSPLKLAAAAEDVAAGMSQRGAARRRGFSEASLRAYQKARASVQPAMV